ncbi:hypothetical protein [Nocardioides sp. SYSU DS0651]|uniref:hypothetical protein n=1 Tax=Nocardioides sp. SYSU DS0651 TaxID=3415955 RepID=UPI003F4B665F
MADQNGRKVVSLRLDLLDKQVVDAEDEPVGRIDDLELAPGDGGAGLAVAALLVGQSHLGARMGGVSGRLLTALTQRLTHDSDAGRLGVAEVRTWTEMPRLRRKLDELPAAGLETWMRANVVRRLPGADDEGK